MEPLRRLTCKDAEWQWLEEHRTTFRAIQDLETKAPMQKYHGPAEELTIQCDASDKGLGAVLLQNGIPTAFASRTLTDTERRCARDKAVVTRGLDQGSYEVETDDASFRRVRVDLRAVPVSTQETELHESSTETTVDYPGEATANNTTRPVRARREPAYLIKRLRSILRDVDI